MHHYYYCSLIISTVTDLNKPPNHSHFLQKVFEIFFVLIVLSGF